MAQNVFPALAQEQGRQTRALHPPFCLLPRQNMDLAIMQRVFRAIKKVFKKPDKGPLRLVDAFGDILVIGPRKGVAEIPGVLLKRRVVRLKTQGGEVFDQKKRLSPARDRISGSP